MSEQKNGVKMPVVLAVVAALGILVANNVGTCFKTGPKLGDDVVAVGAKSDIGTVGDAVQGAEKVDPEALALAEAGAAAGRTLVELAGDGHDLAAAVGRHMEEDSVLPAEEWGTHEDEGDEPISIGGQWCTVSLGGAKPVTSRMTVRPMPEAPDTYRGVRGTQGDNGFKNEERIEVVKTPHKLCIRSTPVDEPDGLAASEAVCKALIRLTDDHMTLAFEGPQSWVRCDESGAVQTRRGGQPAETPPTEGSL
jgi:hypothetical protein